MDTHGKCYAVYRNPHHPEKASDPGTCRTRVVSTLFFSLASPSPLCPYLPMLCFFQRSNRCLSHPSSQRSSFQHQETCITCTQEPPKQYSKSVIIYIRVTNGQEACRSTMSEIPSGTQLPRGAGHVVAVCLNPLGRNLAQECPWMCTSLCVLHMSTS